VGTEATWITAREFATRRGRKLSSTQELILRFESGGVVRVRRVPSRRGKPRVEVCLEDVERLYGLDAPPANTDAVANDR
jgi:hypothetical protein